MKVVNKSRKIISINGEPFLPGAEMELTNGMENHLSIIEYIKRGIFVDANAPVIVSVAGISDLEKEQIEKAAIARYKAEQEVLSKAETEIKAVKSMKKDDLLSKAAGMGVEVADDDTADVIRERILAALTK